MIVCTLEADEPTTRAIAGASPTRRFTELMRCDVPAGPVGRQCFLAGTERTEGFSEGFIPGEINAGRIRDGLLIRERFVD
jgi:hypothetical protein